MRPTWISVNDKQNEKPKTREPTILEPRKFHSNISNQKSTFALLSVADKSRLEAMITHLAALEHDNENNVAFIEAVKLEKLELDKTILDYKFQVDALQKTIGT